MGIGETVDNLVTKVSLQGVAEFTGGQRVIGAGFKMLKGDIAGAGMEMKAFAATSNAVMVGVGVGMMAAGAGIGLYLVKGAEKAATAAEGVHFLGLALQSMGKGGQASAAEIEKSLNKIPMVIPNFKATMLEAAQSLAWTGAAPKQIESMLPAIVDTTVAMNHMGRSVTAQQMAFFIYKAVTTGQVAALRRVGLAVDATAFKTDRLGAITKAMAKFHGDAAAEADTYNGAVTAMNNSFLELQKSLGNGLRPVMTKVVEGITWLVKGLINLNEKLHGWVGIGMAAVAAGLLLGGAYTVLRIAGMGLRQMYLDIAGAAALCTGSMEAQGAAALSAGAANAAGAVGIGTAGTVGAGGLLARFGGTATIMGILSKGFGALAIGAGVTIAGNMITAKGVQQYKDTHGAQGKGSVVGVGITDILAGAATGFKLGGVYGAAAGALVGGAKGIYDIHNINKEAKIGEGSPASWSPGQNINSLQAQTNEHLKQLVELAKIQNRVIIGGGARAATGYNDGDVQRGMFATLSRQMI